MTEKDQKFISSWASKKEAGQAQYFLRITLLTCLLSAVVIFLYTWKNIPPNKFFESLGPLSILIFGMGIPVGLFLSWRTWTQNNNRYRFLTKDGALPAGVEKKKWAGPDRIWDIVVSNIGALYFLLLYLSLFLFDNGKSTLLKQSAVSITLSYFVAQIGYAIYRYRANQRGDTKIFPLFFKYAFGIIILATIVLWGLLFAGME